ncbi:MAG TPA: RAMP superfamily CRISPR-associated protein, partial [Alphaproteobacteria bacterium]|nr:RAMP superfamily CRISPR-associated protein [Alphaproteobacteria bacterium]
EEYPDRLTVLQTPDGRIRIPASTLRGALRARARKILILWIHEFWKRRPNQEHIENTAARSATAILEAGKQADRLLENLFGSTTWASTVQISDFVSTKAIKTQDLHHQYFNAIDRFTGGVAEGALYEARAIPIGTELKGQLRLALRAETSIPPWTRLLLGLVLRDMAMGDIAIGWGKAKGYGTIKLRLEAESTIATLVGFQPEDGDDWLANAIRSELDHGPIAEQPPVDEQEVLTND